MGFLSDTLPGAPPQGASPAPTGGSFLSTTSLPTARSVKEAGINVDLFNAQQASDRANSFGGIVKQAFDDIKASLPSSTSRSWDLNKGIAIASAQQESIYKDSSAKITQAAKDIFSTHTSLLQKGVAVGEAGMGALSSLFTIVTVPLTVMASVPGVGVLADSVNKAFGLLGQGGSIIAGKAVDILPVSPQTKATIKPLAQEIGALSAQILAGKAGEEVFTKLTDRSQTLVDAVVKDKTGAPSLPTTPAVKGGFLEQTANPTETPVAASTAPEAPVTTPAEVAPSVETPPAPSEPAGNPVGEDVKVSKLASDIADKLKSDGVTPTAADLATYKTEEGFMKAQASRALDLITKEPDKAKAIAMGEDNAPEGLKNESVFAAVREKAFKEADTQTLLDLSKSKVATEASIKGQDIKALDVGDHSTDPVKAIKEVQKAREAFVEKQTGKSVDVAKQKIVSEDGKSLSGELVKEKAVSPKTWAEFIDQIKCSY